MLWHDLGKKRLLFQFCENHVFFFHSFDSIAMKDQNIGDKSCVAKIRHEEFMGKIFYVNIHICEQVLRKTVYN